MMNPLLIELTKNNGYICIYCGVTHLISSTITHVLSPEHDDVETCIIDRFNNECCIRTILDALSDDIYNLGKHYIKTNQNTGEKYKVCELHN